MKRDRDQLIQELRDLVAKEGMIDPENITLDSKIEDLSIQSADFIMILMAIEDEYGTYISIDTELTDVITVHDLINLVVSKIEENPKDGA